MTKEAHTDQISVSYLSWINEQLRKEVERKNETARRSTLSFRFKSRLTASVSMISLAVMHAGCFCSRVPVL